MTSAELCSLALGYVGLPPITSLDDPTEAAKAVKLRYPLAARTILRSHEWACARKYTDLAREIWVASTAYEVGDLIIAGTSPAVYYCTTAGTSGLAAPTWPTTGHVHDNGIEWTFMYLVNAIPSEGNLSYSYALPADYMRIISLNGLETDYELAGSSIGSDSDTAELEYIADISALATLTYPDDLAIAIACEVAAMLALSRKPEAYGALKLEARESLARARASAGLERADISTELTAWTDA